jgi:hypothetical protein
VAVVRRVGQRAARVQADVVVVGIVAAVRALVGVKLDCQPLLVLFAPSQNDESLFFKERRRQPALD